MKKTKQLSTLIIACLMVLSGCSSNEPQPVRSNQTDLSDQSKNSGVARLSSGPLFNSSNFAVLAGTTITNDGESVISGDLGVSPGTAITGFQPEPINAIMGPGTVTAGLGIVDGIIYPGGPVAEQAHSDAVIAYDYLVSQPVNTTFAGVTQLNGVTFTPGVYRFAPSANLQVNGAVYLDFQGNSDALFIFQMESTLVTMTGSQVIAINNKNQSCIGSNVFWAVGSSATIDGAQFIGNVIATTTITMTSGASVSGRIWAINGAITMIDDAITACAETTGGEPLPPKICNDFITGGGSITGTSHEKRTFGISGGKKHGEFWGNLSYSDHGKNGLKVKSLSVTAYVAINELTRQIEGVATINGKGSFKYKAIVTDNGEPGGNDFFSIVLSNGYSASGTIDNGNIQLHKKCSQ